MCKVCVIAEQMGVDPEVLKDAIRKQYESQGSSDGPTVIQLPMKSLTEIVSSNPTIQQTPEAKKVRNEPPLPELTAIDPDDVDRMRMQMQRNLEAEIVQLHYKMISNRNSKPEVYEEIKGMVEKFSKALKEVQAEFAVGAPKNQPMPDWMKEALGPSPLD